MDNSDNWIGTKGPPLFMDVLYDGNCGACDGGNILGTGTPRASDKEQQRSILQQQIYSSLNITRDGLFLTLSIN